MRKLSLFLLASVLCPLLAHAQLTARIYNYRPTGELGFVMKPAVSGELQWQNEFEGTSRFRSDILFSYVSLKPRLDTFPTITVMSSSAGTFVLPGKQAFHKFALLQIGVGFDYEIWDKDPFIFFGGMDLVVGSARIAYYEEVPTLSTETYNGGGVLAGGRLRLGVECPLGDAFSAFINANRSYFIVTDHGLFSANDYGIGLRYNFN